MCVNYMANECTIEVDLARMFFQSTCESCNEGCIRWQVREIVSREGMIYQKEKKGDPKFNTRLGPRF